MTPYLVMLGCPALAALAGLRRKTMPLLLIAVLYWVMIGFRYQVGMDWNNYIHLYIIRFGYQSGTSLTDALTGTEPGFAAISWFAANVGGGMILINIVSASVFCWGFFTLAARCREPFLAIVVATPLLVVGFAMSGVRQAMAIGVVFYLFANWERRTALSRTSIVLIASLFHFSAIFVLAFVAWSGRLSLVAKIAVAALVCALMVFMIYAAPGSMGEYSALYVSGKVEAPGAIAQVGVIALAAIAYFTLRVPWAQVTGDPALYRSLAVAALLAVPVVLISSVGAYRFALYLWPLAMHIYSGLPAMIKESRQRALYRLSAVIASTALLSGWLLTANNASAWFPYQTWLSQPSDAPLIRH